MTIINSSNIENETQIKLEIESQTRTNEESNEEVQKESLPLTDESNEISKKKELLVVISRFNEDVSLFKKLETEDIIVYNKGNDGVKKHIDESKIIKCDNLGREGGTYIKHILDNYDNLSTYTIFTQGNPVDHVYNEDKEKTINRFNEIINEEKDYKFKYISTHMIPLSRSDLSEYGSGIPMTPVPLGNAKDINELIDEVKKWVEENCPDEECINPAFVPHNNPGRGIVRELEKLLDYGKETIFPYEFTEICVKDFWYLTSPNGNKMRIALTSNFNYDKIMTCIENGYSYGFGAIFIVHKSQILKYPKKFWIKLYSAFQELQPSAGLGMEKLWGYLFESD